MKQLIVLVFGMIMLSNTLYSSEIRAATNATSFKDVSSKAIDELQPGQKWYVPYVNAAVQSGIHRPTEFNDNWDQPITRQEMARLAVRALDESLRGGQFVHQTSTERGRNS